MPLTKRQRSRVTGGAGRRDGRPLIIVESPTKARTIERALGRGYSVAASLGHLRDLPRSQLGVDVEQGFEPRYITVRGRGDVVRALRAAAQRASQTYLGADPDREGEAIAWHLAQLLGLDPASPCRIVFHEITREAVSEALRNPRPVNMDLVDAQQARRVLDRLMGYELSPFLWRKVRRGLSAGRVQSVAVRLICEREREIRSFEPREYWTVEAALSTEPARDATEGATFKARFVGSVDGDGKVRRVETLDSATAEDVVRESREQRWRVLQVRHGTRRRNAPPPFTTSTLQQEAWTRLGFSVRRTMRVAQQLYEGVELGEAGPVGLITYMRTDSTRVSETARVQARELVSRELSPAYVPEEPPRHKTGPRAQAAHEAVRPTDPARTPASVRVYLGEDQFRLYRLIWERFIASEMAPAVWSTSTVDLAAGPWAFRASGSELEFPGYLAANELAGADPGERDGSAAEAEADAAEGQGEGETAAGGTQVLPELVEGQTVVLVGITRERHLTSPPPRYSEGSLVRAMEELGIGRPSTYAPTIETILSRGYVERVEGRLVPTRLGEIVTSLLLEHFPDVVDVAFTANLEDQLDRVEEGLLPWREVVAGFYGPFQAALRRAEESLGRVEVPVEEAGVACEVCGRPMVVKYGRFGRFLACSGYPECRHTRPYAVPTGQVCPKCGGEIVEKRTRRGRRFYGCLRYPECDFSVWSRPTDRVCPECGTFLVVGERRSGGREGAAEAGAGGVHPSPRGRLLRCPNDGCGFEVYEDGF